VGEIVRNSGFTRCGNIWKAQNNLRSRILFYDLIGYDNKFKEYYKSTAIDAGAYGEK
jgi:hypothetical protein